MHECEKPEEIEKAHKAKAGVPVIFILVFTEQDFDRVYTENSVLEAKAMARGLREGANLYGAGSCGTYVMPDHESEMHKCEKPEEIEKAHKAIRGML